MKIYRENCVELNAIGLRERLEKVGLEAGRFINKKSNIVYVATFYDDKKEIISILT